MNLDPEELYREAKRDAVAGIIATLEETLISEDVIRNTAFPTIAVNIMARQRHTKFLIELVREKHGK